MGYSLLILAWVLVEQESYNIANSLSMESTSPLRLIGVFMHQTLEHIDVPCYITYYHTHYFCSITRSAYCLSSQPVLSNTIIGYNVFVLLL